MSANFVLQVSKIMWLAESGHHVQLVGMSATLPNMSSYCRWMKADHFCSQYRPIDITSTLCVEGITFNTSKVIIRHEHMKSVKSWQTDVLVERCRAAVTA